MRSSIPHRLLAAALGVAGLGCRLDASAAPQADPKRNEVIGLTRGTTAPALVWQQADYRTCAQRSCALTGFLRVSSARAGGTAWNGDVPPNLTKSLGGIWISNGKQIAQVDPATCALRCASQLAPLQSASAEVTGLAYLEADAALLMSDSQNLLYWIDTSGCTLAPVVCSAWQKSVVPAGYTIGGLATDDVRRFLFVSASTFGASTLQNKVWAAYLGFPPPPVGSGWCGPAAGCEMAVPACGSAPLGAICGLGFDACTSTLYLSDGRRVLAARFDYDAQKKTCSLTALGCCDRGAADPFGGLCVVQKQPVPIGRSCVGKPCSDCPSMVAGTYGAAFLGNKNFALTLAKAPTGATPVILGLGVGGCVTPGVSIGFCETVKIGLAVPPLLVPMRVRPVGSGPCQGSSVLSFGVPTNAALCGVPLSAQWAMDCTGTSGRGHAITNCVTFEITTN